MIQLVSQLGQPYKTLSYKTKVLLMAIRIPPNYGKKYTFLYSNQLSAERRRIRIQQGVLFQQSQCKQV